ncbi:MAG: GNAT family N-acetyltransferase [Acholeplasmataceae bacterium]|nr:GNAT family N-acetyltransferase [Acholeplasmataceae bacterium]
MTNTVALRTMTSDEYQLWIEISMKQQAIDRQTVTQQSFEEELAQLHQIVPILLPAQEKTPDHYFYVIDTSETSSVGMIWIGKVPDLPENAIFLYDIHLHSEFRSKGIGRQALILIHKEAKRMGFASIFLAVLKNNYARYLYDSIGYVVLQEESQHLMMVCNL